MAIPIPSGDLQTRTGFTGRQAFAMEGFPKVQRGLLRITGREMNCWLPVSPSSLSVFPSHRGVCQQSPCPSRRAGPGWIPLSPVSLATAPLPRSDRKELRKKEGNNNNNKKPATFPLGRLISQGVKGARLGECRNGGGGRVRCRLTRLLHSRPRRTRVRGTTQLQSTVCVMKLRGSNPVLPDVSSPLSHSWFPFSQLQGWV